MIKTHFASKHLMKIMTITLHYDIITSTERNSTDYWKLILNVRSATWYVRHMLRPFFSRHIKWLLLNALCVCALSSFPLCSGQHLVLQFGFMCSVYALNGIRAWEGTEQIVHSLQSIGCGKERPIRFFMISTHICNKQIVHRVYRLTLARRVVTIKMLFLK